MVFGSVLPAAELDFPRTRLWSMVSILNLLYRFCFQFVQNKSPVMLLDHVVSVQEWRPIIT